MTENIENFVKIGMNYVENTFINIIWNRELLILLFLKDNNLMIRVQTIEIRKNICISNNLMQVYLNYYCKLCDKTIKLKSKTTIVTLLHIFNLRIVFKEIMLLKIMISST